MELALDTTMDADALNAKPPKLKQAKTITPIKPRTTEESLMNNTEIKMAFFGVIGTLIILFWRASEYIRQEKELEEENHRILKDNVLKMYRERGRKK